MKKGGKGKLLIGLLVLILAVVVGKPMVESFINAPGENIEDSTMTTQAPVIDDDSMQAATEPPKNTSNVVIEGKNADEVVSKYATTLGEKIFTQERVIGTTKNNEAYIEVYSERFDGYGQILKSKDISETVHNKAVSSITGLYKSIDLLGDVVDDFWLVAYNLEGELQFAIGRSGVPTTTNPM